MKILITGATGFVGRNMVEHFARLGHEVYAVCFKSNLFDLPNVKWWRGDLRSQKDINQLVEGMDIVIHAAASTSGSKDIVNNPALHVTDNAIMNSLLFRAAQEACVKHVIFFSCTVMYQSSDKPLKETDFDANAPLHPKYFGVGHTKLYSEKLCEFYAGLGDTKFTAIRHSNIYGPHDKFDLERSHVFGATITKAMLAQDKITVWGTGEEARDFLHIDDLCNFVELVIAKQSAPYGLYNCGSGVAVPVKELGKRVIEASGKGLIIDHDLSAPTIPTSLCLDCSKALSEFGWEPKVTLEEGIARTLRWWKDNIQVKLVLRMDK